ncbi:MAG TPA: GTP 3',8-cyclase MoaA [Vulgatibacter sp.]
MEPVRLRHPAVLESLGRALRDLRISVTDRCNFRCGYCMPAERFGPGHRFLPSGSLLDFDEIEAVARAAVRLGVEKIRLTGGEPLLRPGIEELVQRRAGIEGLRDLALTTNGTRLAALADGLAEAGLRRVTVSLDALDDETFGRMNGVGAKVAPVLEGIEAAMRAGLAPLKVNMVVRRGLNDHAIAPMARRFRGLGATLRFIEYMDVGETNGWRPDHVVPAAEIVSRLEREVHPLEPVAPRYPGEVARRWRYDDGSGEIGIVSSVSAPFCGACTRARITADGVLYTCLFATAGLDLKPVLRSGSGREEVEHTLAAVWSRRDDRYSELRGIGAPSSEPKVEMSRVGG